jgi:hypothetical protein
MAGTGNSTPQRRPRANLTPAQQRTQQRFESLIGLAAPFLDLVLAVGDRISRAAEPEDFEYYPVRAGEPEPPPEKSATARRGE